MKERDLIVSRSAFINLIYSPEVLHLLRLKVEDIPYYTKWYFDIDIHGLNGYHVAFPVIFHDEVYSFNVWLLEDDDIFCIKTRRDDVIDGMRHTDIFEMYVQPDFLERCGFLLGGDEN